jgi:rRNA small subunit pseudouridine methyltransferase Nep1
VVLENAGLDIGKTKHGFVLLNGEEHENLIKKMRRDPDDFRPDLVHQTLLALLDSPLNKHNKLQVLIRTQRGVTIELSPDIRIPRTFKRFAGLFCQLLQQGKIQSAAGGSTLITASKHLVSVLLPKEAKMIRVQKKNGVLVDNLRAYIKTESKFSKKRQVQKKPLVFVVSLSDGHDSVVFKPVEQQVKVGGSREEETVSLSNYELSSLNICSRVCFAYEELWGVL